MLKKIDEQVYFQELFIGYIKRNPETGEYDGYSSECKPICSARIRARVYRKLQRLAFLEGKLERVPGSIAFLRVKKV